MGLHKIIKIVGLILSAVGAVILGMIIMKGDDVIKDTGSGVDGFLYTAYIIFALVLISVVVFGLELTTDLLNPTNLLSKVLLPTFVLP